MISLTVDPIYGLCCQVESEVGSCETDSAHSDMKTKLVSVGNTLCAQIFSGSRCYREVSIMPDITDVKTYDNAVVVFFADGTRTSAVLDFEDKFNFEYGISICITKKLLGEHGHSIYNKLINRAYKVIKANKKKAEAAEKRKEEEKKARELKKARSERRKAKRREAAIEMQKEAYKRAILELKAKKYSVENNQYL